MTREGQTRFLALIISIKIRYDLIHVILINVIVLKIYLLSKLIIG